MNEPTELDETPNIFPGAEPLPPDELKQAAEAIRAQVPDDLAAYAAAIPRPVAIKYTIDGEVVVMGKQHPDDPKKMVYADLGLPIVEPSLLPCNWQARHDFVMGMIYEACQQIKNMPKRQVPLTRGELQCLGATSEVANLDKWGFIKDTTINLRRADGKGGLLSAVVYFTPKGRAYIRQTLNPSYGLPVKKEENSGDVPGTDPVPVGAGTGACEDTAKDCGGLQ